MEAQSKADHFSRKILPQDQHQLHVPLGSVSRKRFKRAQPAFQHGHGTLWKLSSPDALLCALKEALDRIDVLP